MFLRTINSERAPGVDAMEAALRLVVDGITGDRAGRGALDRANGIAHIHRLIADRAWTDAALALLALELPQWKLRRLVCEDGEWFCSLSMRLDCPAELDEPAEAHNAELPLAIVQAAMEAWERSHAASSGQLRVPSIAQRPAPMLCCDNFG
jgi:hypothetical protein